MKTSFKGTRIGLVLILTLSTLLLTALTGTYAKSEVAPDPGWSKAILIVGNMSCRGCVDNITTSLKPLPGIGKISVDVTAGAAEIYFNPIKLQDPQRIAAATTKAGYPSKIERLITSNQVRAEQREMAQRSTTHIASVGEVAISRHDYDMELAHARKRYQSLYGISVFDDARGARVLNRLKAQITSRLISDGVKLQEVARAGYEIAPQRVAQSMDNYLNKRQLSIAAFKANLNASGYTYDYFHKEFSQRLRVQSYLENVVLTESVDSEDRQQRYANWLSNATALAKVVYYDKRLEALVKSGSQSGCGGTSCSVAAK